MLAKKLLSPEVVTIATTATVREALQQMYQHEIHHLLIMDGSHLRGILADRDILQQYFRAPSISGLADVWDLPVLNLVRDNAVVVDEHASVRQVLAKMRTHGVSAVAVQRQNGGYGILTESDMLSVLSSMLMTKESSRPFSDEVEVILARPLWQNVMKILADVGI